MQNFINSIDYKIIQSKSHLVFDLKENVQTIPYYIAMAEKNNINGVLPIKQYILNGNIIINYDITNKKKLKDIIYNNQNLENQAVETVYNIVENIILLPEYFLQPEYLVLDLEYTFVDAKNQIYLPILPLENMSIDTNSVKNYIMSVVSLFSTCGCDGVRIGKILAYLIKPDFRIDEFYKFLKDIVKSQITDNISQSLSLENTVERENIFAVNNADSESNYISDKQDMLNNKKSPLDNKKEKFSFKKHNAEIKENKKSVQPINPGFAIPSLENSIYPNKAVTPVSEADTQNDKKDKGLFSIFGKKENKNIKMNNENVLSQVEKHNKYNNVMSDNIKQQDIVQPNTPAQNNDFSQNIYNTFDSDATFCVAESLNNKPYLSLTHNGAVVNIDCFPFTVGRKECNYIIQSNLISKKHITIFCENDSYYVQDENSSNHTYLDGVMLYPYTKYELKDNVKLTLANEIIFVKLGI